MSDEQANKPSSDEPSHTSGQVEAKRPRGVRQEVVSWMPFGVRRWYVRARRTVWFKIAKFLVVGLGGFLFYTALRALTGDWSKTFVTDDLWPWLKATPGNPDTLALRSANGVTLLVGVVLLMWLASCALLVVQFAALRNRAGQIWAEQRQAAKLQKERDGLTGRVAQLDLVSKQGQQQVEALEETLQDLIDQLAVKSKEAKLASVLNSLDIALVELLQGETYPGKELEDKFAFLALRMMFGVLSPEPVRGCVYIPDPHNPDWLIISDWETVGGESRAKNRYYIGPEEPTEAKPRGIPGAIYCTNQGEAIHDIQAHPQHVDVYKGERPPEAVPYKSGVFIPIPHPSAGPRPLGVLVFDSMRHVFTQHDLVLVTPIAIRLGIVLNKWHGATGRGSPEAA